MFKLHAMWNESMSSYIYLFLTLTAPQAKYSTQFGKLRWWRTSKAYSKRAVAAYPIGSYIHMYI